MAEELDEANSIHIFSQFEEGLVEFFLCRSRFVDLVRNALQAL